MSSIPWEELKRQKLVETFTHDSGFSLTPEECEKCRFEIVDMSRRMAECVTHRKYISHGVRLHPPHLYKLENGMVFGRQPDGSWRRWYPDFELNKRNVEIGAEEMRREQEEQEKLNVAREKEKQKADIVDEGDGLEVEI